MVTRINDQLQAIITAILTDRPIAYHAILARAFHSVTAGVFLSQLLYWSPRCRDQESWVWKTQKDWYEETALTRREQETARRILRKAGVLEEKRTGIPARLYFRVNTERLSLLLSQYQPHQESPEPEDEGPPLPNKGGGGSLTSLYKSAIQERTATPDRAGALRQFPGDTENTAETTKSENTPETTATTAPEGAEGVVAKALTSFGMSEKVVSKLAQQYPEDYLLAKVDQMQWLIDTGSPQAPKNPAGYLRRAIEEDYIPPPRYENHRARQEELAREEESRQQREVEKEEVAQKLRQQAQQGIEADTSLEEAWSQALVSLRGQITSLTYKMYLEKARPLGMEGNVAIIETTDQFGVRQLEGLWGFIVRALGDALGKKVEVEFVAAQAEGLAADD